MNRTPGFFLPTSFPVDEALVAKIHEASEKAGFEQMLELEHSGVKGMKWGVHHTTDENAHSSYSRGDRAADHATVGRRGVNRINASLHEGKSLKEARKKEAVHQFKKAAVILGASVAVHVMNEHGSTIMRNVNSGIYEQALKNRGQAAADRIMQDRMITQNPNPFNYTKPNRKGVHNITTL